MTAKVSRASISMAGSAMRSTKKEGKMSSEANNQADQGAAINIDAIRSESRTEAATIVSTCQLAGFPDLAAGFIQAGEPLSSVVAKLADAKAKAPSNKQELRTDTLPEQNAGGFSFAQYMTQQHQKGGIR
jgi:hypothetical protein